MKTTSTIIFLGIILFISLFIAQKFTNLDFWWMMSGNIILLLSVVFIFDKEWKAEIGKDINDRLIYKIGVGLLSALILYVVFYIGNYVSRWMFTFAGENINNVYSFKEGASPVRIVLLMLLIIGPGEELFWRAFVQRKLQNNMSKWKGFVLGSLIYTLVHVASGNVMLVLAAGICGFFWGYLYYRTNSILLNVVSHTIWDLGIFVLLPVN